MMKRTLKFFAVMCSIVCGFVIWNCEGSQMVVNADSGAIEGETGVEEVPDGFWGEDNDKPEVKPEVSEVFPDIADGAWYEAAVQYVYDNGYMSGSNGLFKPTADITRAQIVTILYKLAGSPKVYDKSALSDFSDIQSGDYFADAVCWGYAEGVAYGSNGKFNPTGKLTRQQMAAFFYRFADVVGMDTMVRGDISSMLNADKVADYAKDAVEWAVGKGLISGSQVTDAAGNKVYDLKPTGNTTRAQVASILQRFCESMN